MRTFQVNTADRAQLLRCLRHQAVKIADKYAAAYLLLSRRKLLTRKIRMLGLGVGDLCDSEVRQLRLM